ncbi:MAG: hypothetical protein K2L49_01520 [Muribaculaceae bacterium]|nr:hypothetical protein [Muribaculaceae bacterium]
MTINRLKLKIKKEVNYAFFREYRYRRVARRHLSKYYSPQAPRAVNTDKLVIGMADGKYLHGGLADRLRGLVTLYSCCRQKGVKFGIRFTSPFNLTEYLQPNRYDWRVDDSVMCMNSIDAKAVYMDNIDAQDDREPAWQKRVMERCVDMPYRQIHVYSSFSYVGDDFGRLFRELFRPSPRIESMLEPHRQALGDDYISVSTRFMELLGDFREPRGGQQLDQAGRIDLIRRCIDRITALHDRYPDVRILVTSDSTGFLAACRQLDYVYTVDGEISHVDASSDTDHSKTFVDFLLIAGASHAYQLRTGPMYAGNFSLRAAQAGDRPHTLIEF